MNSLRSKNLENETASGLVAFLLAVTNNLQAQDLYTIRGLMERTSYDLKVTAHNHAGSSTAMYQFTTLDTELGPSLQHGANGMPNLFSGIGVRATLSIFVSVVCLFLASVGVCICIRKSKKGLRAFQTICRSVVCLVPQSWSKSVSGKVRKGCAHFKLYVGLSFV